MFYGTYDRNLDSKGRLQLPSDLSLEEGMTLYVMKGLDGCISIYPEEKFSELTSRLASLNYFKPADRAFIREALSSVKKMKIDAHGRISLTVDLLRAYKIEAEVQIIGVFDHFEVWEPKSYEGYLASQESYEALAERTAE
ncbi:MAG: division/cell wall cluster transcriptional repressor MraZ [Bacilli bacterium]|nr:division/cell wall cluster transcriptional repressor MraZ [Bacilli bacterium]